MTDDQSTADPRDRKPAEIDPSVAHPARVYDYLLGGKDNYAADRAAAEMAYANYPGGLPGVRTHARAQRAFLGKAVHHLAGTAGIRQFLDIGTGIPTANNTHEVAQRVAPQSRVVYVDNDPIVLAHARALLAGTPEGVTSYIDADLRDPQRIVREAGETLDFDQPVAVMLLGILHFFGDGEGGAYDTVSRLLDEVPSGSYLVIANLASDVLSEMVEATRVLSEKMKEQVYPRTHAEVARFFDGLELVGPGVVQVHRWQPDPTTVAAGADIPVHCGVGRKP